MGAELKSTPLRAAHLESGARLVEFGGWEMPVQYRGINEEHRAVRHEVGIFDVSHMGQVLVKGPGSLSFLQKLLPRDLEPVPTNHLCYAVMCDERGGAVDDLLVYRLGTEEFLLVVNASRVDQDLEWLLGHRDPSSGVDIEDCSPATGMLAVQGPLAEQVLRDLGGDQVADQGYLQCQRLLLAGEEVLVSLWRAFLHTGAVPCGLGARDVLRTEMGYCLYGHELGPERTPLEAGLAWTLSLGKPGGFVGQHALLRQQAEGKHQCLVGLRLVDSGIPRPEFAVMDARGERVGTVSSGTYSPALQKGIALAFVAPEHRQPGTQLQIDLRGQGRRAEVVKPPFVPSKLRRMRKP